jgi:hypothetical protein
MVMDLRSVACDMLFSVKTKLLLLLLAVAITAQAADPSVAELRRGFENPPDDARIMMRWWWFGPSVNKAELEREMRLMKAGGIGGFEVQPVYPLALDEPDKGFRNFAYLSPEFLEAVRFTSEKARELGLRMDLTLGSGWPFGGPHIPVTEAAGRLRCDRVPVPAGATRVPLPDLAGGESFIAAFLARGDAKQFAAEGIARVTDIERGMLRLPSGLQGPHVVLFFVSSRTGQQVKRASFGAEGFVLDHMDRRAIERHLKTAGEPMLKALGPNPPYAIFSDSLEVYNSDWTPGLLDEFRKRRSYDLLPLLPALVGDIGDSTAAIRHDWAKTLTELVEENYIEPLKNWAHAKGTRLRSQTYGTPPVTLSSAAHSELLEGEGPHWRRYSAGRLASSAAHLYGRPVVSSETWTWLHSPAFRATPLDMKAEADLHFILGINQLVGHGWPYSPDEIAGRPGWRFYAAAVFNDHNPWWIVMPDLARYLQRVSYLLRQGRPANDVAIYLPTADARASITAGNDSLDPYMIRTLGDELIPGLLDAGYNFDFIDDTAIDQLGVKHPVLILPRVERIPLATYRKIDAYARGGGIVLALGRAPSRAPGLKENESDTPQIVEISKSLRVLTDDDAVGKEIRGRLAPDVESSPRTPALGFIHRKLDWGDVYFVVNSENRPIRTTLTFRAQGHSVSWNPFTPADQYSLGGSKVELECEPYGSRVIVFTKEAMVGDSGPVAAAPATIDLSSGWSVRFPEKTVSMPTLRSWTDDEDTRFFSGQAVYEKTVDVPAEALTSGRRIYLNFGEGTPVAHAPQRGNGMRAWIDGPVREAALVYINDQLAGSVWRPPYEIDVTKLVRPGALHIRVVVANVAINHLAGRPLPDYRLLNLRYGERFQPQDMKDLQPVPSGLLGPIRLIAR